MLILIEWHRNISVQTVACIVKHADPQINSVRGVVWLCHNKQTNKQNRKTPLTRVTMVPDRIFFFLSEYKL